MELGVVAEAKVTEELEDLYLSLFKKKYTQDAILDGETDRLAFAWLASKFPRQKARAMVEAYFHVTDRFVAEKMYPPKLIKTCINQINVLSKRFEHSPQTTDQGIAIRVTLSCDHCFEFFHWVGKPTDLTKPRVCQDCVQGKKQKKAERDFKMATSRPL